MNMTPGLAAAHIQCPHCWETFETTIDCSVDEQSYVEDCYVCCRPILFHVSSVDGQLLAVQVEAE